MVEYQSVILEVPDLIPVPTLVVSNPNNPGGESLPRFKPAASGLSCGESIVKCM